MNSKKIVGFIQMSRPVNIAMTLAVIPSATMLMGRGAASVVDAVLAGVTGACVTAGANAINDYFDLEIDRTNRPDRPLPQGILSKRDAAMMWLVTSIAAIFLNLLLPLAALLIVMGSVVILFVYSAVLKRTVLAGNAVVAGMTGLAFLYAAVIAEQPVQGFMPAGFAFLANFSREIVKDVEDFEGDRTQGASTFPIVHGIRPALVTASIVIWVLIALTVVAHISGIYSRAFLAVVSIVDIVLAYTAVALLKESSPSAMHPHSVRLKLCMAGGLIAIIAGSL